MEILDPKDKKRLLAIEGLRKFVNNEEDRYVKKLKAWKNILSNDAELKDPRLLAATLVGYLQMNDDKLSNLMWDIWRDDELRIIEFYDIISKYFVDREAGF